MLKIGDQTVGQFAAEAKGATLLTFPLTTAQLGDGDLVDLVKSGHAYVKISAPYRPSDKTPDFPDVAPLAQALVAANPDRVVILPVQGRK